MQKDKELSYVPVVIYGLLSLLIIYLSLTTIMDIPKFELLIPEIHPIIYSCFLLLITIPILIYGLDIITKGIKNLISLNPNIDTLLTLGILTSTIYSLINILLILLGNYSLVNNLYFIIPTIIIYLTKISNLLEQTSKNNIKEIIKKIINKNTSLIKIKEDDEIREVNIDSIKVDDIIVCEPGSIIEYDGEIVKGTTHVDESYITGESLPIEKKVNDKVYASSTNYEGYIEYKVDKIGLNTTISKITKLVIDSKNNKQVLLINKISNYLLPIIILITFLTLSILLVISKQPSFALINSINILIISIPLVLVLISPITKLRAINICKKNKLLIKNSYALEIGNNIDTVIFDKTGTLTNGTLMINIINNHSDLEKKELLELLGSVQKHNTHPIGVGIRKYLKEEKIKSNIDMSSEYLAGYGIKAKDGHNVYYACNRRLIEKLEILNQYKEEEQVLEQDGNTVLYLVKNNKIIALFGLKDIIRKSSINIIKKLKEKNIKVMMLTGDNEIIAKKIAEQLEIESVYASVTPEEKKSVIKKLQNNGKIVMMVGDGINDAPALKKADIGISIESSCDNATNTSDIILLGDNLLKIIDLLNTSKKTYKVLKQNIIYTIILNTLLLVVTLLTNKINILYIILEVIVSIIIIKINSLRIKNN